jgi:transcription-repair coupling factor (superfamily II helicase)
VETAEDCDDLFDELNDRFGDIPKSVSNLISISKIRHMGLSQGFTSIEQNGRMFSLYNPKIDIEKCAVLASEDDFKGSIMISLGGRPHISYKLKDKENVLEMCEKILARYSEFTKN